MVCRIPPARVYLPITVDQPEPGGAVVQLDRIYLAPAGDTYPLHAPVVQPTPGPSW